MKTVNTLGIVLIMSLAQSYCTARGAARGPEQQHHMQLYTLDVGMAVFGADLSPDSRYVAVVVARLADSDGGQEREFVYEVQVWDFRARKIVARKTVSKQKYTGPTSVGIDETNVRYGDAGSKLVVYSQGQLHVLDSNTLNEVQTIDLGMSAWPNIHSADAGRPYVADIEVDLHARHAAVLLSWGVYSGGELRVYDLLSGSLMRKWSFSNVGFPGRGPISIDPSGQRVAIAVLPFSPGERRLRSDERNIQVLDVDTGRPAVQINTGYIAGAVCFVRADALATASLNPDTRTFAKDSIRIWDAHSGKLTGEIFSKPEGVHEWLQVSADGRVAFGYVGLEKRVGDSNITVYRRFRLWDLTTGNEIVTSPDLLPIEPGNQSFRLSAKGDLVLVYPIRTGSSLLLYQLE